LGQFESCSLKAVVNCWDGQFNGGHTGLVYSFSVNITNTGGAALSNVYLTYVGVTTDLGSLPIGK
jgi:hypothetical protein